MELKEALQELHNHLGNDPECDCDDCTKDREILLQLAQMDEGVTE